jgi:ribosomal protein L34E
MAVDLIPPEEAVGLSFGNTHRKIVPVELRALGKVDCARCRREMIGEKTAAKLAALSDTGRVPTRYGLVIKKRINGRPYCPPCAAEMEGTS